MATNSKNCKVKEIELKSMRLIENWLQIVKNHDEKAIIPFLKQLNEAQKEDLLPQISKTAKEYLEIKDRLINHKHFYAKKASNKQERILNYSIFVCAYTIHHPLHKWLTANLLINNYTTHNILNWYCPTWLTVYLNEFSHQENLPPNLTYDLVVDLEQKGYFQPSKKLIARLLPKIIFELAPNEKFVYQFVKKNLNKYPITLNQHFWLLFDYPSQIHTYDRQIVLLEEAKNVKDCWFETINYFIATGKINRIRLLKESLASTNKKEVFNKPAAGWFAKLFTFLEPSETELLAIQSILFSTLNSPYTKANHTALKSIKKIARHPSFQVDNCLMELKQLLISSTQSIVFIALQVLEELVEVHPSKKSIICDLATLALLQKNEPLQVKAAKIIHLNGNPISNKIRKLILKNEPILFYTTRQLLADFIPRVSFQRLNYQLLKRPKTKLLSKKNRIPSIDSVADFIELSKKVFDNQAPYHFDQFIAGILQFQQELNEDTITQLKPLFNRAYQLVFNELPRHQGMLDNLLAVFLLDLSDVWQNNMPKAAKPLKKLAQFQYQKGFFFKPLEQPFDLSAAQINRWYNLFDPSRVYVSLRKILCEVLVWLHEGIQLPLLSTPTHHPTWVDPLVLVKRLAIYEAKNQSPNPLDFQLAVSRVAFENIKEALNLAKEKLSKKYVQFFQFLLSKEVKFPKEIRIQLEELQQDKTINATTSTDPLPYFYLTAYITKKAKFYATTLTELPDLQLPKSYFTGNHPWMIFWEERDLEEWNYKTQRLEPLGMPYLHTELQVKLPKHLHAQVHPKFLYQYFPGNKEAFRPNVNDIHQLLGLLPNNPEPLIALLIADNLKYPNFWEKDAQKRVNHLLDWLDAYNHKPYGSAIHLCLAACMLNGDKNIRIHAAKIWLKAVIQHQLNASHFGQIIGRMEYHEFAPLKRLTDLIIHHLLHISELHNQVLETVVAEVLAKLPAVPIKNTKKLLQIYRELLATNQSKITHTRLFILLDLWRDFGGLRKVVRSLDGYAFEN